MFKPFRDLFGSKKATLDALASIRARLEHLESVPVPDLPPELDGRLTALSHRDAELQADIVRVLELIEDVTAQSNAAVESFDGWRKELVIAVSEGIERTDRAERRIKATVARARGQLANLGYEDPGLEAETVELRLIDGEPSGKSGVPPVPAAVAETASEASSVRGVSAETLRRARGF